MGVGERERELREREEHEQIDTDRQTDMARKGVSPLLTRGVLLAERPEQ